ncbi:bifunctional metallophosphatase/5'-nucleotidase [candidate division KSB1 bacterium]|nr:bifunctional metallophosphatase/5'-nucleotidase [candidate division KSB1 bacterium]
MRKFAVVLWMLTVAAISSAAGRQLVIFHTNDIHGHFVPEPAEWRDDKALVGGVAALEAKLTELRKRYPATVYLDAGDLMTGNPICTIDYDGVRGGALHDMLQRVGITAQAVGNHDLDLGADHATAFVAQAAYPQLCANLIRRANGQPFAAPTLITEQNGLRIGVIGLILDGLADVVAKKCIDPFSISDAAETAQRCIDELDPTTDLIILLTHIGVDGDRELARKIHGADVIIGGHSHTRLKTPELVNQVIIAQAGSYCKNLGVLELTVDGDSVTKFDGRLDELLAVSGGPRTALALLADSLETVIQARYGEVIGDLGEPWTRGYYKTSNVGNWICDRLREQFAADVALVNAGGIRSDWSPGPITLLKVMELLPFENSAVTFDASGAQLLSIAREQALAHGCETHGVLEVSGLTVRYRKRGAEVALTEALVNGQPIDSAKSYRVASIDFVAVSQAERYLGFQPSTLQNSGQMLNEFITAEIKRARGPITADPTPRIEQVP